MQFNIGDIVKAQYVDTRYEKAVIVQKHDVFDGTYGILFFRGPSKVYWYVREEIEKVELPSP